jgi:glycerol-3-phosphate acyltransferase PlsX
MVPRSPCPRASTFLASHPEAELLLVGLKEPLERELARARASAESRITVVPASQVVAMDEDVRTAIRTKKIPRCGSRSTW